MFKTVVQSTPLTSCEADGFFQNITGEPFMDDVSFIASLRALVYPRMQPDEHLRLTFSYSKFGEEVYSKYPASRMVDAVCDSMPILREGGCGTISVHNFVCPYAGGNESGMNLMEREFEKEHKEWHRLEKITDFFRRKFRVLCFVNPEQKNVILFTNNMDVSKMHYLQCAILAFLPWYFSPEAGVSELEMELIESLRGTDSSVYQNALLKISAQYDFRVQRIRSLLAGFETRYEKIMCEKTRNIIENIIKKIEELDEEIGGCLQKKAEQEIVLLGLETKIQGGESHDSAIMEYFISNDKLALEAVTDKDMVFSCKGYLTYFDEDAAKNVIENRRSFVYRPRGRLCNNFIPENDMRKLMNAVFIDQTLKMKFCAAYSFPLDGQVSALPHHRYGYEFADCTPNPHIDMYNCMGNYKPVINQLLTKHDYIGAIEQCIASCVSLNFSDPTVMAEFMTRLYGLEDRGVNMRCIELPDKSVVTPKEAIEWLNKQEGANGANGESN